MNDTNKTLNYYMRLNWTFELRAPSPNEDWSIMVQELPGCWSQGNTAVEALLNIKDVMEGWIEAALEYGDPIPEPKETPSREDWEENAREAASAHIPIGE